MTDIQTVDEGLLRKLDSRIRGNWPKFQENPDLLLEVGIFRLMSDVVVDEDGIEHMADEVQEKHQIYQFLRQTHFQRRLQATRDFCRELNQPTMVDLVKARRIRATTRICGSILCNMMTKSGYVAFLFGPGQKEVEKIFKQIPLTLWDNMIVIPNRFIHAVHKSVDRLSLESKVFNLKGSEFFALPASPATLNRLAVSALWPMCSPKPPTFKGSPRFGRQSPQPCTETSGPRIGRNPQPRIRATNLRPVSQRTGDIRDRATGGFRASRSVARGVAYRCSSRHSPT